MLERCTLIPAGCGLAFIRMSMGNLFASLVRIWHMIPFIGNVCTYPKALKNRKNISVIIKPPHSISPAPATGGAPRRKEQMNKLSLSSRMYWHCFPAHLKLQVCSFSSVKPVPSQNLFASAKVTSVSQLPTLKTHCHLQIPSSFFLLQSFAKVYPCH